MPTSKPPYPAEFRQQMVDLHGAGRTIGELSREFGVSKRNISTWIAQSVAALTSAEREELSRLRRQVRQLQQERDILAKATAWFAGRGDKTSSGSMNS
jgi:transposase